MRMKIKRTLVSALCLALCLCLCGCVAGVDALNKNQLRHRPPAQVEYDAPTGDTNQETAQSVLLYVPSAAGTRLIAQTEKIVLSAARTRPRPRCAACLPFAGNDSAQSLSPDVTLQLSTVNPVEISGDTATVNLAASALSLSHSDLYVACQAIANTLTQWGDIRYVNVLVSSIQPGLDVGASVPAGCFAANARRYHRRHADCRADAVRRARRPAHQPERHAVLSHLLGQGHPGRNAHCSALPGAIRAR